MLTLLEPLEALQTATPEEEPLRAILSDDALSMGEKLLMVEALFVHDSESASTTPEAVSSWHDVEPR